MEGETTMKKLKETGVYFYSSNISHDSRGDFAEIYNEKILDQLQVSKFVQQNFVKSSLNVIRGMHWQSDPFAQAKLITVLKGRILDVFIDLREKSDTFNEVFSMELDSSNLESVFIPTGFAHGYQALEQDTLISYSVTSKYSPDHEKRINPLSKKFKRFWKEPYLIGELDLHSVYQDD